MIRDLLAYRTFIRNMVVKDLKLRYQASVLGFLWSMLNPLLMLGLYTVVFSEIMRVQMENYTFFLFSGLMPWTFFSGSLLASTGSASRERRPHTEGLLSARDAALCDGALQLRPARSGAARGCPGLVVMIRGTSDLGGVSGHPVSCCCISPSPSASPSPSRRSRRSFATSPTSPRSRCCSSSGRAPSCTPPRWPPTAADVVSPEPACGFRDGLPGAARAAPAAGRRGQVVTPRGLDGGRPPRGPRAVQAAGPVVRRGGLMSDPFARHRRRSRRRAAWHLEGLHGPAQPGAQPQDEVAGQGRLSSSRDGRAVLGVA